MNAELTLVLALLAACVAMFVANRPRMDAVALLVVIALPLSGVLSVPEALAGFSDPSVVLIAAMFVVGEGLVRTGVAYQLGEILVARAHKSETRLLVLLMLSAAALGSVMSSTGVVAILIPVTLGIAARLGVPPGRLMMPLSVAALISGMLTLVATPPNMVVDSALRRDGATGFGFFSFTPIGLVILLLGVAYMLVARRWLSAGASDVSGTKARRSLDDLINDYQLAGRGQCFRVRHDSPLVGQTLQELNLRREHQINVIGVQRYSRFQVELLSPTARLELRSDDVLLVESTGPGAASPAVPDDLGLEKLPVRGSYFTDESREVGMAEVMLPPESGLIGQTVRSAGFRTKYGLNVVGLRRGGRTFETPFLEESLKLGDTLLVIGTWKSIRQLQAQSREFLVLTLPAEIDTVAPALRRAPFALLSVLVMVAMMVSGIVPNVMAALIACMLMGLFRCVDMQSAYRSIHWQSLIVIVGMMPFAIALERTGGVALAVDGLLSVLGGAGPRTLLATLFIVTAITGLFVSNTATAVLMAPVALGIADHLGVSPRPFAMTVALAASAAFMTPVSSPVNTLVYGPGQYRFGDFVKVGVPFTVVVLAVTITMVPWLFPLHPAPIKRHPQATTQVSYSHAP